MNTDRIRDYKIFMKRVIVKEINIVPKGETVVRKAELKDVSGIVDMVNIHVGTGDLLPRTEGDIIETLNDWVVADKGGKIVAIGSLLMYSDVLAEVRSLAVSATVRGEGIGYKIVSELKEEGKRRKVERLFALTRAVNFFQRQGFTITDKENFPQKVYNDCEMCPLKENCDETAVVLPLEY